MYHGQLQSQSNRADWQDSFEVVDSETGDLIDISGCRITMTVRKLERNPNYRGDGFYGSFYDNAIPVGVVLTGSTDTGEIVVVGLGVFQWLYPMNRLGVMSQGDYQVGVRISQVGRIEQLMISVVNFYEGLDMQ
jgi:hypothetical protein